jgi:hypothetical protein
MSKLNLFEIEDCKDDVSNLSNILNRVVNTADKLQVRQGFTIPITEFSHRNVSTIYASIRHQITKLINRYKSQNIEVEYTVKTLKDVDKNVTGFKVIRTQ